MVGLEPMGVVLAIVIATLAAIVYSMRILVMLERRIARMDMNLMKITRRIAKEELKIESAERMIARTLKRKKR